MNKEVRIMFEVKHLCMVLGGTLLGSAGVKLLSSKDAKKAYCCG